jgi:hypothetical protein
MSLRFVLALSRFGTSGTRLSVWRGGTGFSMHYLMTKGRHLEK